MGEHSNWKGSAKRVLYTYPYHRELITEIEQDIIHGGGGLRDGRYRRGGVSNPTQSRALRLCSGRLARLQREVQAVDAVLRGLATGRRNDAAKLKLLDLVYFEQAHLLKGAARELGISERTAKRWNSDLLREVAQRMGWV